MKLPFINYIVSALFAGYKYPELIKELKGFPIPLAKKINETTLVKVYNSIYTLDTEYFTGAKDLPNIAVLDKLGVTDMVWYLIKKDIPSLSKEKVKYINGAFDILYDMDMFIKMSALALAGLSNEDIELMVERDFNIFFDEPELKAFLFYFFNVKGWTLSDKKEYVDIIKRSSQNTEYYHDMMEAYEIALTGDKNYLMWKLNLTPHKSFEAMLNELGTDSFYFFKQKAKFDGDTQEARDWANVFLKTVERAEKLMTDKTKDKDFYEDLSEIIGFAKKTPKVEEDQNNIMHIQDLEDD
jgi:hypothetical protein